jgi:titin
VDYYSGTTKIGSSTVAPFSFTWTGVPAGTYTLNATATDDVGNVTRSSNVGLTVYALPAPVGLAAVAGSSTTATVSWKDNTTNESGYYLYRSPGTATFTQIAAPAAGVTNYTDSSLAPGGTYQYRLVAFNANGQSPAVTTAALVLPPNPPANFKATVTNSAIQLSWTAAAGAKGYSVLRLSTVSNAWTTIGTTTALSFRDTNVVSGPVYYYWLTAQNTGGQASAAGIQTASLVAPAAPAGVTATPVAGGIRINWTDMSYNEDSFAVERSLDGVYFATTATLPANSNTWTDPGVISGTKYYYRVRSSLSGISSYSAVVNCIAP